VKVATLRWKDHDLSTPLFAVAQSYSVQLQRRISKDRAGGLDQTWDTLCNEMEQPKADASP